MALDCRDPCPVVRWSLPIRLTELDRVMTEKDARSAGRQASPLNAFSMITLTPHPVRLPPVPHQLMCPADQLHPICLAELDSDVMTEQVARPARRQAPPLDAILWV